MLIVEKYPLPASTKRKKKQQKNGRFSNAGVNSTAGLDGGVFCVQWLFKNMRLHQFVTEREGERQEKRIDKPRIEETRKR